MIKATRVGKCIVCIIDQKMYQKVVTTDKELLEIYDQALNTDETNMDEMHDLLEIFVPIKTSEEIELEQEYDARMKEVNAQKELASWMTSLEIGNDPDFEVKGHKLYMKGINITIPEFIAAEFAMRKNDQGDYNSLMNFWKLCALNSDPKCREDL